MAWFTGATARGKTVPGEYNSQVETHPAVLNAKAKADDIEDKFGELKEIATGLAAEATGFVAQCQNYTARPVNVSYTPPVFVGPTFNAISSVPFSDASIPDADLDVDDAPSVRITDNFSSSNAQANAPSITPADVGLAGYKGVPSLSTTLNEISFTEPSKPTASSVSTTTPTDVDAPDLDSSAIDSLIITLTTPTEYEPPDEVDLEFLAEQLAAIYEELQLDFVLPDYDPIIVGDVFSAVGSLFSEHPFISAIANEIDAYFEALRPNYEEHISSAWSSLHQPIPDFADASIWLAREGQRFTEQADVRKEVARLRFVDDSVKVGMKLGAAAHSIAMDIMLGIKKAELDWLLTKSEALMEYYKAMVSGYQAVVAQFEGTLALKEVEYLRGTTKAMEYEVDTAKQQAYAEVNENLARRFEANERAKGAKLLLAQAEITREESKLEAFGAEAEANDVKTQVLEKKLHEYRAKLAQWFGGIIKAKAEFEQYAIKAEESKITNQARAEKVQSFNGDVRKAEAKMKAEALKIESKVATYEQEMAEKALSFASYELTNKAESLADQSAGAAYFINALNTSNEISSDTGKLEGKALFNEQAITYLKTASEAAGKAAEITLQSNAKLAEAYNTAQQAAGRASARIQHGKFSRWQLGVSMSAEGSWQVQKQTTDSWGTYRTLRVSQSESETKLG